MFFLLRSKIKKLMMLMSDNISLCQLYISNNFSDDTVFKSNEENHNKAADNEANTAGYIIRYLVPIL